MPVDEGPNDFDVAMGFPLPCTHCTFAWRFHRCNDQLCPGTHHDGSLWPGAWEREGAPGTRYDAPRSGVEGGPDAATD